jgi:sortase A
MMGARILGKFLISVSTGILLFVLWLLWGTGLYSSRAQERLASRFDRLSDPTGAFEGAGGAPTGPPERWAPEPGAPVFRIEIPDIGVRQVVVEGAGVEELKKGPGHYPSCRSGFEPPLCSGFDEVWPGEPGRVIVSGHRTTYGAPFEDLDKLEMGDDIRIETKWGEFVYEVTAADVIDADSVEVVEVVETPELALTTCSPKYSAAQRLVIYAELQRSV